MDITQTFGKFSILRFEDKLKVKENGRPVPDLTIEHRAVSRGKPYFRKFNRDVYSRCNWICGCNVTNKLYCFPCVLFGGSDIRWAKTGVDDLVHLSDRIKSHENSKLHILNVMNLTLLGTVNIQAQLDGAYWIDIQKYNDQVTKNRHVLSKIIDCIKFCGAFELALRGHDDTTQSKTPGVFLGLINFTSEIDKTLQTDMDSTTIFTGMSEDIQNDILQCMLDVYYDEIKKEIDAASFLAIMADETTDCSSKFQMSIILRYVKNANPVERFWGFFYPFAHDSLALTTSILSVIDPLIAKSPEKLIAQSYDGAAVMSGKDNGIQANIRKRYPLAYFIHSYAHELNLIMAQAASQNSQVRSFFSNIHDIPTFFSNSPRRVVLLDTIARRKNPHYVPARWNFKIRTVNIVFEYREQLIECMEAIENGQLGENRILINQSTAIRRMLQDKKFIFWLNFFQQIMPHVDTLFKGLQKKNMDSDKINKCVEIFENKITELRQNQIKYIENETSNIVEDTDNEISKRKRTIMENNRTTAIEVCDIMINVAKDRFAFTEHLTAASLFSSEHFPKYDIFFPEKELVSTVNAYNILDQQRLKTELSIIYAREEYRAVSGATSLLKFLIYNNLEEPFKEVIKLLKIIVTVPMATAEAERSFSTLKRIKTFLHNSMEEECLTALAVLSIESKFIKRIPNFNEKVINVFAYKKTSPMDLIYKETKDD